MDHSSESIENVQRKGTRKWCFVPRCTNTTVKTPNKVFLTVPRDIVRRKLWLKAARRDDSTISTNAWYACEDRFNLQEDLENYWRFKMMGAPARLKKEVFPHIFDCQPNRTQAMTKRKRPGALKLQRIRTIQEITQTVVITPPNEQPVASPPCIIEQDHHSYEISTDTCVQNDDKKVTKFFKDVGIQAKPHYRSKSVFCKPETADVACSTMKYAETVVKTYEELVESTTEETTTAGDISLSDDLLLTDEEYHPSDETSEEQIKREAEIHEMCRNIKKLRINKKPKMYIGIPSDYLFSVNLLQEKIGVSMMDIHLTLAKIKLNDTFERLGDEFGISASAANRIFHNTLPLLANHLKSLIHWPSKEMIKRLLPIPFRARYSNVQSIIDCLEIEIQKPSDPLFQALTWSEYKSCNTLKYLISATPDGVINFISEGFGGRTSDTVIFEKCGFLEVVPCQSAVMADRGFKHVEHHLQKKGCTLIRPPSVSSSAKPTKEEVMQTKRIASLRIHIERIIRRMREFEFLKPHSCIDHQSTATTDHIITIVAGLVNLQKPIITG